MKGLGSLASGEGVYKAASGYRFSIAICELLPRVCRAFFSLFARYFGASKLRCLGAYKKTAIY